MEFDSGDLGGNWAEFYSSGSATISGDVYARGFNVKNSGTTVTINGNGLNYAYDSYIASGSTLALTGNVNFGGGITLQLSGNNSGFGDQVYWGGGGGVLELLSSTALQGNIGVWQADNANGQSVKLSNGSTISIGQTFKMMGTGVTGNGALFVNDGTANTWGSSITLFDNSTIGVGSNGGQLTVSGVISGDKNLTVKAQGGGTVTLSAANTYTGSTTVSEGTLAVNGSLASGVTVASGATLQGSGTISGATTVSGNLKPGNSPGLLTFDNSLTLDSTAATTMEITGANSSGTRGTTYDAVNVASALAYGGTLLLNFDTLFTQVGNYAFNLFDSATTSGSFGSVSLAGVYSGSFTNNSGVWGLTQGDNTWSFNQGDGVLSFTVIPEPNVAMVAGSLALMALLRRRRD